MIVTKCDYCKKTVGSVEKYSVEGFEPLEEICEKCVEKLDSEISDFGEIAEKARVSFITELKLKPIPGEAELEEHEHTPKGEGWYHTERGVRSRNQICAVSGCRETIVTVL